MGIPALIITKNAINRDDALSPNGRGGRRILVTHLRDSTESEAMVPEWEPPVDTLKCPVIVTPNAELSYFNEYSIQSKHFHKLATEIYTVVEGKLKIEIEDDTYLLGPGDCMIINPGCIHKVIPILGKLLCQVISINCLGLSDKYVIQEDGHHA